MDYGFIKVAAAIPHVSVADCFSNIRQIEGLMRQASVREVQFVCFPELSVTAYTCLDLFSHDLLLDKAKEALLKLVKNTADLDLFAIVGLPLAVGSQRINAAVAFQKGEIVGIVPKSYLPNEKEFQEHRWFTSAHDVREQSLTLNGKAYSLDPLQLFTSGSVTIGIEVCEDLWVPVPPSSLLAMAGAQIIFNLSASNELIGKHNYRRSLIKQQSARCIAGYVYASAGFGESTTDLVFDGHGSIAEAGVMLEESERFRRDEQLVISEIDIQSILNDRRQNSSFMHGAAFLLPNPVRRTPFQLPKANREVALTRAVNPHPFVPSEHAWHQTCEEIIQIQLAGLAKRITHIQAKRAVIGVSGGLDSTLALLITAMTFDALGIPRERITGVTMPGFGTTGRTYNNAIALIKSVGVTLREISISKACLQHFEDIGHDPSIHDVTYENTQARERTQILMDIANQENGLVVGTGDLSELALGWATFNGDHMSMYGLNSDIPKTLVRTLVEWIAGHKMDEATKATLLDIAATPISPELIPCDEQGNITQITEELVGPYELHDFFLYHFMRFGSSPRKIFYLAQKAFGGAYDRETIKKWLSTFCRRFFNQQFKRNCLPDGPKVGSISLSPRGDWRMASDAAAAMWLKEVDEL